MKKIFLILILMSCAFIFGMEEKESIQDIGQAVVQESEIPDNVLMYLLRLANESDNPDEVLQNVMITVLKKAKKYAAGNLPIEVILHMIDATKFSSPIALLAFLGKFSSLNKHLNETIKPHIIGVICRKCNLNEKATKKFIELVNGRSGIPLEYLEMLLISRHKQKKIKELKALAETDLGQAIKNLESLVYANRCEEAMDVIMSLPKKISHITFNKFLRYLIINSEKDILKMLFGAGMSINALMIEPTLGDLLIGKPLGTHPRCMSALVFAAFFGYAEMVKFLLQMGVNVNAIDCHGLTALDYAIENKYSKIEKLLKNYGGIKGPRIVGPWNFQPFGDYHVSADDWVHILEFKEAEKNK